MILLVHLIIVFASLGFSTFTFFSPSLTKLYGNYILIAGVVVSGVWLTILNPSHLPQSCFSGLLYLGIVLAALTATKRKLAHEVSE